MVIITVPAQDLWKGITSVSNAGRKRGRGKNVSKSKIKDLNRGQIIGIGKVNELYLTFLLKVVFKVGQI